MAQQVINVGAAANDGTGDPLRTAYIKTNSNFGELYSRTQTSPPVSLDGSAGDTAGMYAYDSNYFYYCYANYTGNSQIWNQITNTGNVSVTNIASGNSSIQFDNINGNADISIRGVANVAVFKSTGLNVTGAISATGAVTAAANVNAANIYVSGQIVSNNNITGQYFVGNGAFLTGVTGSYNNGNVAVFLPTYTGAMPSLAGNITTTANVSGAFILGNGSQLTGLPATYANSNVATYLAGSAGNIIPAANVTYSLGDATHQWKDLWVSNSTIYINSVPVSVSGNTLQVNGQPVLTNGGTSAVSTTGNVAGGNLATAGTAVATGNITGGNILTAGTVSATGNITGNYILGNGSQLTGLPATYGNANVATYLPTYTGALPSLTGAVTTTANISAGNISATAVYQNGVRAYKFVAGNTAPSSPAPGDNWWYSAGNVLYQYINDGVSSQWVDVFDPSYPPSSTSVSANTIAQRDAGGNLAAATFTGTNISVTGNISASTILGTVISSGVSYTSPFINGVARSGLSKWTDIVSVRDFGATGDGTTDDTSAVQSAITAVGSAGGGQVYFPAGTYKISAELTLSSSNVVLIGSSRNGTTILQAATNTKILNISGNYCGVQSLGFNYTSTPTAGATAIYITSAYVTLNDFVINAAHVGVYFYGSGAVAGKASQFEIFNYVSAGLICDSLNDVFISQFIMNAGNATNGALGGIRLLNKCEAFIATDGDILLGVYSITTDATSYSVGNRPAYCNFTNIFFDSAANGAIINKMVETEFVGCWFSGGRSGSGNNGLTITNSDSLRFTNTRWDNNGASGCYVASTAVRTVFTACKFEGNSVTAGAGAADGLLIEPNTQHFQILGCQAHNGLIGGQQRYGINISSGCDYFIVQNNDTVGNYTGGIVNSSGTSATKLVANNL